MKSSRYLRGKISCNGRHPWPPTKGTFGLSFTIICLLLMSGCDRYSVKPICSSVIGQENLGAFSYGPRGTATDTTTGTIWYRCPGGSYYLRDTCSGDELKLTWDGAVAYAEELSEISGVKWRLATLPEVRSIISPSCVGPAVNPNVFPSLKATNLWTLSQSSRHGDSFRCTLYTYNGAHSCKQLKKFKNPFLLVQTSDSLL